MSWKKNIRVFFVTGILIVFLFSSCYKTDFDKITDDIVWSPDISLSLGEAEASQEQVPPLDVPFHYSTVLYDTI